MTYFENLYFARLLSYDLTNAQHLHISGKECQRCYLMIMVKKYNGRGRHLRLQHKRIKLLKSKLSLLKHISKKNCALLQYLDDESLHTLGEFIYNIIHQKVKLDPHEEKRVKLILKKDKEFYRKLIDKKTKHPLGFFRKTLKFDPQVGNGIVSLIAALAPLISSLIIR